MHEDYNSKHMHGRLVCTTEKIWICMASNGHVRRPRPNAQMRGKVLQMHERIQNGNMDRNKKTKEGRRRARKMPTCPQNNRVKGRRAKKRHEAKLKSRERRGGKNLSLKEEKEKVRGTYNNEKMQNERFGARGYGALGTATDPTQCVGRIERWEERARWMEILSKRNKQKRIQEQQNEKLSNEGKNEPSTSHHTETTTIQEEKKGKGTRKKTNKKGAQAQPT